MHKFHWTIQVGCVVDISESRPDWSGRIIAKRWISTPRPCCRIATLARQNRPRCKHRHDSGRPVRYGCCGIL